MTAPTGPVLTAVLGPRRPEWADSVCGAASTPCSHAGPAAPAPSPGRDVPFGQEAQASPPWLPMLSCLVGQLCQHSFLFPEGTRACRSAFTGEGVGSD